MGKLRAVYLLLGVLVCAFVLPAQEFRATITGFVTDPSGAPVAGAKITVTSVERNTATETTSNAAGNYVAGFLLPGKYTVQVEKTGFKKYVREGITLASSDKLGLDIALDLGAVAESVTVTAEASLLQTESSARLATIQNRAIEDIPTNGRNLYQLQFTLPGVVKTSRYWGSMELYAFGNVNGVMISGGRQSENETLVDGSANTRADRGVAWVPSLNSIQEFTVQSNAYDAQFGRVGGGVTTITLKSGTNGLHGQLFDYYKNHNLNANSWAANTFAEQKVRFNQHTFGFDFNGPVYVPKVFDGRNKLFFLLTLEGLRERNPGIQGRTIPLAEQLGGNFSNLYNSAGAKVLIYDPQTTQLGSDGKYSRQPFSGNLIPASRINPVAAKVASFYPSPTSAGIGPDHNTNYVKVKSAANGYDAWLGKMDYHVNSNNRISWRYAQTPWSNFAKVVWGDNAAEPSGEAPSLRISRNWGADWTSTISPTNVFNLRFGLARYEGFGGNIYGPGYDPRQLGFPSSLVSQFTALQFPRFNLGTYSELGASSVTSYETHDTWSLQPNMSTTIGRHILRYGAEFRRYNRNQLQPGSASGNYTFNKTWTQANPQQGDAVSGNEFASFLLGYPASGYVDRNIDPAWRHHYYAMFFQDDWKITPKITLNIGLRWDYESPDVERYDRMIRSFDRDVASPIASKVSGLTLKGGLVYAGVGGVPRGAFASDKNNFQPRVGIAWNVASKWVLRAGYGLTYLGQFAVGAQTGFSQQTALVSTLDNGLTPAVTLSDPFPTSIFPTGLQKPVGNSLGLSTNLGLAASANFTERPLPYSQQYSVGVQRELPGSWLIDASYVGNTTSKLSNGLGVGLNFIPLNELTRLAVADRPAYFNERITNPMAGLLPGSSLNGSTLARQLLLYAYPQYSGVSLGNVPIGSQRYDSLQLKATRRFRQGFGMQVSYTLAKGFEKYSLLNAQDANLGNLLDTQLEKRLLQWDVPQNLALVLNYELPFGKGKWIGGDANRWVNGFIGGWNLNWQWMRQSGFPFDFATNAPLRAGTVKLTDGQRDANAQKAGRPQFDPLYDKWFDVTAFPTTSPAPFTLRNWATRFPDVRAKHMDESEVSVYKEFGIREGLKFQLRGDFQNIFNVPHFNRLLTNTVTDSRFGQLYPEEQNQNRIIVLVAKLVF